MTTSSCKVWTKGVLACAGPLLLAIAAFQIGGKLTPTVLGQNSNGPASMESQRMFVNQYCAGCHNDSLKSGGFSWTAVDLARPEQTAELAESVIQKVRSRMMPPAGYPCPEPAAIAAFASVLETRIDQAAARRPFAGAPELHRMNRTEYRNAVRDLLGQEAPVSELLPPDSRTGGFDNMSDALTVTPSLMSAYLRGADKISRDAVGDPNAAPRTVIWQVSKLRNQMRHIEGAPLGTRGGTSVLHTFPADGQYVFKADLYHYYTGELIGSSLPLQLQDQEIEFSVDGERVAVLTLDPTTQENEANYVTPPVPVLAGQRRVAAAFVSKFDGPVQDHYRLIEQTILDTTIALTPEMTGLPHLRALSVTGPFSPTGVSESVSRRKIFTCRPAAPSAEQDCATRIISKLAGQAFRRPVTAPELEGLLRYYRYGRENDGFEEGIRTAIQAILTRPEFIFRFEYEPRGSIPGSIYRISDLELASRLSFFLWSSIPDDTLIQIAREGMLQNPSVLEQQVRRMLADPKSEALAENFAIQWLRLGSIEGVFPDARVFPDFTWNLADSMRREIEFLFDSIVREDRRVLDLMTADYTFVDEVLARHYGIPNVLGERFRRVPLTDPNRFGLLGKAAILTVTSPPNRTSPVARGKYVLEVLMGAPPPAAPPAASDLEEEAAEARTVSVRERMERHRAEEPCASCHKIMDPIGLALENFDGVGSWRVNDGVTRIDATSEMYDGTPLSGPVSVRHAIVSRSELFVSSFTKNLLTYALGRTLDYRDMPTVRSIVRNAAEDNYRFSTFILEIVRSTPFQMRTAGGSVALDVADP